MQFAKDSFYMTLRERLSTLNPERHITLNGTDRTAIVVLENENIANAEAMPNAFYLLWGGAQGVDKQGGGSHPLQAIQCAISYFTSGTCESGVDRGRVLANLDTELLSICQPPESVKRDYTQLPSRDLGTKIFWTAPELGEGEKNGAPYKADRILEHTARLTLFFFPELP